MASYYGSTSATASWSTITYSTGSGYYTQAPAPKELTAYEKAKMADVPVKLNPSMSRKASMNKLELGR
jgi:hypothetical protein